MSARQMNLIAAAATRVEPDIPMLFLAGETGPKREEFQTLEALGRRIVAVAAGRALARPSRSPFSWPGYDTIEGFGLATLDDDGRREWIGNVAIQRRPLSMLEAAIAAAEAEAGRRSA